MVTFPYVSDLVIMPAECSVLFQKDSEIWTESGEKGKCSSQLKKSSYSWLTCVLPSRMIIKDCGESDAWPLPTTLCLLGRELSDTSCSLLTHQKTS